MDYDDQNLKYKPRKALSESQEPVRDRGTNRQSSAERRQRRDAERYYVDMKAQFGEVKNLYHIHVELGRGAYGVVYKGYEFDDQGKPDKSKKVAIKAIFSTTADYIITSELCLLRALGGKNNIVKFKNAHFTNKQYFVVTEYHKYNPFDVIIVSNILYSNSTSLSCTAQA